METSTVVPTPDRDSQAWWSALANGELCVQECGRCHRRRWPLREYCAQCGATSSDLVRSTGTGTVASWTTVWRSPDPRLPVPYVVALVRLDDDEDILMPGWIEGSQDGNRLQIGLPVTVGFAAVHVGHEAERVDLVRWRARVTGSEEQ